jgi:phenylacetaldehyde dehydrogenase
MSTTAASAVAGTGRVAALRDEEPFLVGGVWLPPGDRDTIDVVDPASGAVLSRVAQATAADVDAAVRAAGEAHADARWRGLPPLERTRVLQRVADLIEAAAEELAVLETRDNGKPIERSRADTASGARTFRHFAGAPGRLTGTVIPIDGNGAPHHAYTLREPVGVAALVLPWNFPIMTACFKLAPALAAGCAVVVKPAEQTPLTMLRLAALCAEAGLPDGVLNVLTGDGEVGAALVAHPGVAKVSFTGSTEVGRLVMAAAAPAVKRLTLELGGKSPNIVFADADFETAIDNALTAAFVHSGQVCSAGCRLIVEDSIHDRFVEELGRRAERIRLGGGLDAATETGALISEEHRAKVERYIAGAIEQGARLVAGGTRPAEPELKAGFYVRPTVFADCTPDMTIIREEVFGPVVTVERFTTEDEAIRLANDTTYGLAGAVWTSDASRAQRVAGRLRHGTVWINDYNTYMPQAEWGGFKQSGIGRELGPTGLDEYREAKHVYQNTNPGPSGWFEG